MFYFKDRLPDSLHGQNEIFLDALDSAGVNKLSDFKLIMKNNIQAGNEGTPLNAANINFASGVADLPAGANQTVTKGMLLSLNGGKVVPTKTYARPVALASAYIIPSSFFKLDDTHYLFFGLNASYTLVLFVATVDWTNKTVSLGAAFAGQSAINMNKVELISPTMACMAFTNGYIAASFGGYYTLRFFGISGTTVTASGYGGNTDTGYGALGPSLRPVKCGSNGAIVVGVAPGTGGTCYAKVGRWDGVANSQPTVYTSAAIPGITDHTQLLSLVSYDGGVSKYVLIYSSGANGTGTLYARPITVNSDNTFVISSAVQTLPAYSQVIVGHAAGGVPVGYNALNKFIFSVVPPATLAATTPAAAIQTATVDGNGVISMGAGYALPVFPGPYEHQNMVTLIQSQASLFASMRNDGSMYFTGMSAVSPYQHKFMELSAYLSSLDVYVPFNFINAAPFATTPGITRCLAIENPNVRGQFLFAEQLANYASGMSFFFGYETDAPKPNNIIGVALDAPSGGFVKAQTSPKLLTGIASGLRSSTWYMAGSNGALAQWDGVGQAVGLAVSPGDFVFDGLKMLTY